MAWISFRGFHTFATLREKRAEKRKASIEFISAFADELAILKNSVPKEKIDVKAMLTSSFVKHRCAFVKFHALLPENAALCLEHDWKAYYHSKNNFGEEWQDYEEMNFFTDYLAINHDEERKAKKLAIKHIEKLIAHAKK